MATMVLTVEVDDELADALVHETRLGAGVLTIEVAGMRGEARATDWATDSREG